MASRRQYPDTAGEAVADLLIQCPCWSARLPACQRCCHRSCQVGGLIGRLRSLTPTSGALGSLNSEQASATLRAAAASISGPLLMAPGHAQRTVMMSS